MKTLYFLIFLSFSTNLFAKKEIPINIIINNTTYSLENNNDLNKLQNILLNFQELLQNDKRPIDGEYPTYFLKNDIISGKKLKIILAILLEKLENIIQTPTIKEKDLFLKIYRALELNMVPPVKEKYSAGELANRIIKDLFYTPAMHGKNDAKNNLDESLLWNDPKDIASKNLNLGFNRKQIPNITDEICEYKEPKTGYGSRAGYTIKCNKLKVKIKFKEVHSEPFATRIFWALGYHVDPVDYAKSVKVKYDRKILTEFNDRRQIPLKLTFLKIPVMNKVFGGYRNPIESINHLVLKNKEIVENKNIPKFLFKNETLKKPEQIKDNFNEDNESQIDYIVTNEIQFQLSNDEILKIGPWSFNEFDHHEQLEMRGLVLLGALLNWHDVRTDNNRIVLVDNKIKYYLNDVGAMLGRNAKFLFLGRNTIEESKYLNEDFISKTKNGVKFNDYRVIDRNKAFIDSTFNDAKWMANLICQLTPTQIEDALRASGFSDEDILLFKEKLMARINNIKKNFKLD